MAFVEDLPTMFDTAEFAVQGTVVLPADIAGRSLTGIFDAAYLSLDIGTGVESSAPVLTVPDSSIPTAMLAALEEGAEAAVEIDGCVYSIVETKPDGTGVTALRLRK